MTVAREDAYTVLLDEKIYVMGGCDINEYSANWVEVFDIKTQSWTALPGPGKDEDELRHYFRAKDYYEIVNAFKGKIYLDAGEKDYTYEPKDGKWKLVREKSNFLSDSIATWHEVGNVIYCCTDSGYLMWSDSEIEGSSEWREIKGFEKLREHPTRGLKTGNEFGIADCGGNLLVMWDPCPTVSKSGIKRPRNRIWYAKISLESRCNGRELWGKVECVDLLTFPVESYQKFYCLTASA